MLPYKFIAIAIYLIVSVPLFHQVYQIAQLIIDEEFHLRQGEHYCHGRFEIWDPKITTFPGLYLVSAVLLYPFQQCGTFALRMTSLIASAFNVWLIHEIRKNLVQKRQMDTIKTAFEALVISILPPMYFFAHLYYTDILSVTTVLAMFLFNIKHRHHLAAVFGFASVAMRQTNIVWVGMALGQTVLDKLISQTLPFIKGHEEPASSPYSCKDITDVLSFYCKRVYVIPKQIRLLTVYLIGYIIVIGSFVAFVYVNGSIVVGDKSAHEAALHLPQIFYFAVFAIVFAPSTTITLFSSTVRTLIKRWYFTIPSTLLLCAIVHFNTLVHPYLLADNRHYTFYVWNKFFGRFDWAKYAATPVYVFALTTLYRAVEHKPAGFKLIFSLCTVVSIALQQLLEPRYFIIPFLLWRLNAESIRMRWLLLELFYHLTINFVVFYVFFTKEIWWTDYDYVQRLIW